jgi:hypothetical protein
MTTNRLAKAAEPIDDRKNWSLERHCAHANQLMVDQGVHEYRRAKGMFPIHWVVRDGRVVIEPR